MPLPILTIADFVFDGNETLTNPCGAETEAVGVLRTWPDVYNSLPTTGDDVAIAQRIGARYGWRWEAAQAYDFEVYINGAKLWDDTPMPNDFVEGMYTNVADVREALRPDYSTRIPTEATFTDFASTDHTVDVHGSITGYQAFEGSRVWQGIITVIVPDGVWVTVP